ncbi:MAG: response regulator [Bacteroidota bacterium]
MDKITNIIIADDHAVLRSGLKHVLMTDPSFNIIGEADNGHDAIRLSLEMAPDIVVMDVNMPRVNGIEAARQIKAAVPEIYILMLTMHEDDSYILDAISAGINGYILKNSDMDTLISAIKQIAGGKNYFPENVSKALLSDYMKKNTTPDNCDCSDHGSTELTKREREIVSLIVQGFTSHEIAEKLFISYFTVGQHRKNIMQKLKLKNSTELIHYALKQGIK